MNERVFSDSFKQRSEQEFVEWILSDLPKPPTHYPRLKKVNAKGAKVMGCVPTLQPLSVDQFQEKMADDNVVVIDTRSILAFGGGHIPGAIDYVPHLEEHLDELDRDRATAVYCGTGYRASLAASILQKHGFEKVINIPGSWTARSKLIFSFLLTL